MPTIQEADEVFSPKKDKSPGLIAMEKYRDRINDTNTVVSYDILDGIISEFTSDKLLTDPQIRALNMLADVRRKSLKVFIDYEQVDKENFKDNVPDLPFGDTVITTVDATVPSAPKITEEVIPAPLPPVQNVSETKPVTEDVVVQTTLPKTKGKKTDIPVNTGVTSNQYRIVRRVNLPIDGVQYSNNEVSVEVTSSDKENAIKQVDALLKDQLESLKLAPLHMVKEAYEKGKNEAFKTPVGADEGTQAKLDKAQACFSMLQKDPEIGTQVKAKLKLFLETYNK